MTTPKHTIRPAIAGAALVAIALLATPQASRAQSPPASGMQVSTVADLAALCGATAQSPDQAASIAFCHGFLQGAGQYHGAITQPGSGNRPVFCAPNPAPTLMQVSSAFAAWAGANPQHAAERAVDGLVRWASATYPCPQPPPAQRRATR